MPCSPHRGLRALRVLHLPRLSLRYPRISLWMFTFLGSSQPKWTDCRRKRHFAYIGADFSHFSDSFVRRRSARNKEVTHFVGDHSSSKRHNSGKLICVPIKNRKFFANSRFSFELRPCEILEEPITEATRSIHQVLGQHSQGLLDLFVSSMCS